MSCSCRVAVSTSNLYLHCFCCGLYATSKTNGHNCGTAASTRYKIHLIFGNHQCAGWAGTVDRYINALYAVQTAFKTLETNSQASAKMLRVNTSSVVQWSCHNEVKACKQLLLSVIMHHYNAHDNFRTSGLAPGLARRVPYRLQAPCASANVWSVGLVELYGTYDATRFPF